MKKEEVEVLIMAFRHLPKLPKRMKREGRKKIRGYSRKSIACKKDRKRFYNDIPNAIDNFLGDVIEKYVIPNVPTK